MAEEKVDEFGVVMIEKIESGAAAIAHVLNSPAVAECSKTQIIE